MLVRDEQHVPQLLKVTTNNLKELKGVHVDVFDCANYADNEFMCVFSVRNGAVLEAEFSISEVENKMELVPRLLFTYKLYENFVPLYIRMNWNSIGLLGQRAGYEGYLSRGLFVAHRGDLRDSAFTRVDHFYVNEIHMVDRVKMRMGATKEKVPVVLVSHRSCSVDRYDFNRNLVLEFSKGKLTQKTLEAAKIEYVGYKPGEKIEFELKEVLQIFDSKPDRKVIFGLI